METPNIINTRIILEDGASRVLANMGKAGKDAFNGMEDGATAVAKSLKKTNVVANAVEKSTHKLATAMRASGYTVKQTALSTADAAAAMKKLTDAGYKVEKSVKKAGSSAGKAVLGFESLRGKMVAINSLLSISSAFFRRMTSGLRSFIDTADELTRIEGKAAQVNDMFGEQGDLQKKVFDAANRSRGSYVDMFTAVHRMGILAGESFKSTDELVAFNEQLQKIFVVSKSTPQEIRSAYTQLTQAMAANTLQGQEFKSLRLQAPMIIQGIATHLGVDTGTLKEMASKGQITAEVVKNAMFSMSQKVDERFAMSAVTWQQHMQKANNRVLMAITPATKAFNAMINTAGFARIINLAVALFEVFTRVLTRGFEFAIKHAQAFRNVLLLITAAVIGLAAASVFTSAVAGIAALIAAFTPLGAVIFGLSLGISALFLVITSYGSSLGDVIGAVVGGWIMIGTAVQNAFKHMANYFKSFKDWATMASDPAERDAEYTRLMTLQGSMIVARGTGDIAGSKEFQRKFEGYGGIDRMDALENYGKAAYATESFKNPTEEAVKYHDIVQGKIDGIASSAEEMAAMFTDINKSGLKVHGEVSIQKEDLKLLSTLAHQQVRHDYSNNSTVSPAVHITVNEAGGNIDVGAIAGHVIDAISDAYSGNLAMAGQ